MTGGLLAVVSQSVPLELPAEPHELLFGPVHRLLHCTRTYFSG